MANSKLKAEICDFLQYASRDLCPDVLWLHIHLDEIHDSSDAISFRKYLFDVLRTVSSSMVWDVQNQLVGISVALDGSDALVIEGPKSWEQVFLENLRSKEPPSVNISYLPNLTLPLPTGRKFTERVECGALFDGFAEAGLSDYCILYTSVLYDYGEPSEVWSRSLIFYWNGERG